jgi:hypothetical protein
VGLGAVGLVTERIWLFSWSSFGRRLRVSLAPGGLGVGEGVEHELAPGERRVDREVRVPGAETHACGYRAVPGAQSAVAQLGESVGDCRDSAEDAPDGVAAVRSGPGRGVQSERKLCCASQFRQVGLVVERLAALGEDDLGGAFDQFLGAAECERGIVADRAPDALEALADGRRIREPRDGFNRQLRPDLPDSEFLD